MKKRRRIKVLIERRELSIFGIPPPGDRVRESGGEGTVSPGVLEKRDGTPLRCETCGSTEMLRLSDAVSVMALAPAVSKGSREERSDMHCTFSNSEWWVCKPSLHLS